jgi:DNA transposition AAA+ family ATPase
MNSQIADITYNTIAPLTNVGLAMEAIEHSLNRSPNLPGMICLFGPPGLGKTFSATYGANLYRAYYITCKSRMTAGGFLRALLTEMGLPAVGSIEDMQSEIEEQLAKSGRPLIIDEGDHLVRRNLVELVRDIYDATDAPILIIGEEKLPRELQKTERMYSRFLTWVPAQPASLDDVHHLTAIYAREITIADNLLQKVHEISEGSVRRISVNLDRIQRETLSEGLDSMDLAMWGDRGFYDGEAPTRR